MEPGSVRSPPHRRNESGKNCSGTVRTSAAELLEPRRVVRVLRIELDRATRQTLRVVLLAVHEVRAGGEIDRVGIVRAEVLDAAGDIEREDLVFVAQLVLVGVQLAQDLLAEGRRLGIRSGAPSGHLR